MRRAVITTTPFIIFMTQTCWALYCTECDFMSAMAVVLIARRKERFMVENLNKIGNVRIM
jgi:hypothetical protein